MTTTITLAPSEAEATALGLIFGADENGAVAVPVVAADAIPIHTRAGPRGVYFLDLQACSPAQRALLLAYYQEHRRSALEQTTRYLLDQSLPIITGGAEADG